MRVANVFHAGDGNLHPLILFDGAIDGQAEKAHDVRRGDPDLCLEHGGSITGEHGVGLDKKPSMSDDVQRRRHGRDAVRALRLRSGRAGEPGQAVPDAAAVRRGARAALGVHPLVEAGLADQL